MTITLDEVLSEIKLELSGYILDLELNDDTLIAVVNKALRELERYWDETSMITIPFASCIDYSTCKDFKEHVSTIVGVYRTTGYGEASTEGFSDPLYAQQWMMFSAGSSIYSLGDYILNYASWNSLLQIKNTLSTDLAFEEDKHNCKLYINCSMDKPKLVTIRYIPRLTRVEDIRSEDWIDILIRLSVAMTKVIIGRIRTRFTQSNALWTQDGDAILAEGNTELKELRDTLRANANLIFGVD